MVTQLPDWIPMLTRRESAWVRYGFLFPLRAARPKPQCQTGVFYRCENTDLHVCAMALREPLSVMAMCITAYDGNVSWVFEDVATGRAFAASQLDPVLQLFFIPGVSSQSWLTSQTKHSFSVF